MPEPVRKLAITMGEPAGIGPELLVRLASQPFPGQLVAVACPRLLRQVADTLGIRLETIDWQPDYPAQAHQPGRLPVVPVDLQSPVHTGQLDVANALPVLDMLATAGQLALERKVDAIVTAPVHKSVLDEGLAAASMLPDTLCWLTKREVTGAHFSGHTEFFQQQAGVDKVVMMLATDELRICLATTHLPLREVPSAISSAGLRQVLQVVNQSFRQYGLTRPKIAVCGLNPHAGENGLLGNEEKELILPLIEALRREGVDLQGPFPADTLFTPGKRDLFDCCLAMYHDQGLPVVKALGFGRCANITLGLPYIRTSVDHGTALDIAPEFKADESSLGYACRYALALADGKLPGR